MKTSQTKVWVWLFVSVDSEAMLYCLFSGCTDMLVSFLLLFCLHWHDQEFLYYDLSLAITCKNASWFSRFFRLPAMCSSRRFKAACIDLIGVFDFSQSTNIHNHLYSWPILIKRKMSKSGIFQCQLVYYASLSFFNEWNHSLLKHNRLTEDSFREQGNTDK